MFKKIAVILAAAALMATTAGNALAYFEQGHLVRVVYDKTIMTEVATDLGTVTDVIANAKNGADIIGGGADSFLSGALANSDLANLNVAYYTVSIASKDLWLSSKNDTQNLTAASAWTASSSAIANTLGRYSGLGGSTVTLAMGDATSYWNKLDGNGTKVGNFNNFYGGTAAGAGEVSLAALATGGEAVQNLFFWDTPNVSSGLVGFDTTVTLTTLADGSTKASAVPVPPAFFLMGSGLLGMIGLRRRMK